jgi:predicted RNA methylase
MSKTKKLSDAALDVLSSGVEITGSELRITRPLDRKLYVEVNAALEALGGKWNRKAKAHMFDEAPVDALDQILIDGEFTDRKRAFEQFFTPPALAKIVVERADVKGKIVLEPSAGHGALAREIVAQGARYVDVVEKDEKCLPFLSDIPISLCRVPRDFMTWAAEGPYERVVMNPPFSRQQDIAHVMHAFSMLKRAGGRLVAIMAAGVGFRTDRRTREFNEFVTANRGTIEKLPEQSFNESGTNVNTVLVTMERVA